MKEIIQNQNHVPKTSSRGPVVPWTRIVTSQVHFFRLHIKLIKVEGLGLIHVVVDRFLKYETFIAAPLH